MAIRTTLTPNETTVEPDSFNGADGTITTHRPSHWIDEDTGKIADNDNPWNELADQQRADAETARINANRRAFDQYAFIENGAKQQKLALDHQRSIAGAAMIQSAFRNGGMSDRSLSAAFSQAFGRQVFGGQLMKGIDIGNGPETVFVMYGAAKDSQTGKARIAPIAMMGSRDIVRVLKSAGLGDATNDIQNSVIDNSYLGRLTDDQRAAAGVSRPSAPISTGTTVISGAAMRALRGQPRQRNNEGGHFAADGRGGFSKSYFNRSTGENWSVDYGTRDPNREAKWKVLESGPDGMRYENDKTGEVVRVPKGSSIGDVIAARQRKQGSGLTFDERRQLQQEREDRLDARQMATAESRKETEKERSDRHREGRLRAWENAHYSAIERRLEKMRSAKIKRNGVTEEPQYTPEQIAEEEKRLYDQMDADRAKAFPELGGNSSGAATPAPTQTGGNGGQDAPRQFKEGDEQEVNGVRMKLLPSKKNPGKLTWQRI